MYTYYMMLIGDEFDDFVGETFGFDCCLDCPVLDRQIPLLFEKVLWALYVHLPL